MAKKSGRRNRRTSTRRPSTPASSRPLPAGNTFATPDAPPLRRAIERQSATLLVFLHRLPRSVPLVLMLGLLTAALLLKGALGAVFLAVLTVLLVWLAYLSWPNLRGGDRGLRVLAILVVVGTTVYFALRT